MNTTTVDLTRAELCLLITTLFYFLMNGAQIFETAVVVPKWSADPPKSLSIISGPYGLDLKTFWIIIHSLHEITFLATIYFCWKIDPVRNWLLILFGVHFLVRVWTLSYFAPNIIEFQKTTAATLPNLVDKTTLWRTLNYVRVGIFIAVSIGLVPLLFKVMSMKAGTDISQVPKI
jgi:hypothetical protein